MYSNRRDHVAGSRMEKRKAALAAQYENRPLTEQGRHPAPPDRRSGDARKKEQRFTGGHSRLMRHIAPIGRESRQRGMAGASWRSRMEPEGNAHISGLSDGRKPVKPHRKPHRKPRRNTRRPPAPPPAPPGRSAGTLLCRTKTHGQARKNLTGQKNVWHSRRTDAKALQRPVRAPPPQPAR